MGPSSAGGLAFRGGLLWAVSLVSACWCSPPPSPPPAPPEDEEPEWEPVSPIPPEPPPVTGPALGPDGLPTALALAHVVWQLNELCPDTFCEGEFDLVFDSLTCRVGTCSLAFHARFFEERSPVVEDRVEITGWTHVVEVPHGSVEISRSFWDATAAAIHEWEDRHGSAAPSTPAR